MKSMPSNVRFTLKRKALIYDIENYAYVEADTMQADDDRQRKHIFDIAQEGNIDRVNRIMQLAYSELVNMLFPYTNTPVPSDGMEIGNTIETPEEYVISMTVPATFSSTTATLLGKLLHEYIVYRVLTDWFAITNPNAQVGWAIKLEDVKSRIRECINFRCKKVRRRISVLG